MKWLSSRIGRCVLLISLLALAPTLVLAVVTGSISGTVRDASGAVIPGVSVTARNVETGVTQTILTDDAGFYNFPALPIGHYDVSFQKSGFKKYEQSGEVINVSTLLRVDAVLQVGTVTSVVTVTGAAVQVNTRNAQMGEVIGGTEIVSLPLLGRAFTDLLALQPGVVPIDTAQYGSESPSGNLDNGVLSMSGAQVVNNGYTVNGANVVEGFDGGTAIVPNLDSIAEFRILTNNAGAEYGNYAGGEVNVATKSGTNQFHGDAFEFLRNSDTDSRSFFSPTVGVYRQNQFGGTFGGPILHGKLFFFVDYQGTRFDEGVPTGLISVPSEADRTGNLSDVASELTGAVSGPFWANTLSKELGYPVTAGEPYYTPSCSSTANCVFPGATIPQRAWSSVSPHFIPLIPAPNFITSSGSYFTTAAASETLQDDKGGIRVDGKTRIGMISGYYHDDPWTQGVPYAGYTGGGSTVPGFPITELGKAQLGVFSITTSFGSTSVNQATLSYMRDKNLSGETSPVSETLAQLGFAPPVNEGVYVQPSQHSVPNLAFNNYGLGDPCGTFGQFDNVYQVQDDFTKIMGTHTLKFGADYHRDQILIDAPGNNPTISFNGKETGFDFADFLLGAPAEYIQPSPFNIDYWSYYLGAYGEDSWRATRNLTVDYGLRWEVDPYWAGSDDQDQTMVLGEQSKLFPTAPLGYVFPGDPGIPAGLTHTVYNDFGPRLGLAYAPSASSGPLHFLFGGSGKSSIRIGYGLYYTNIRGSASYANGPPGHLYYESSAPPLLAQPFITRSSGLNLGQRFPIPVPPANVSASNPDANVDWSEFEPISGTVIPYLYEKSPYSEHVDFSIQREITSNTLLSVSYVGTFGHHLIVDIDDNPGNPNLCLSLSQPSEVLPGTAPCGPFGENGVYYPITGGIVHGTRAPFGPDFSGTGYFLDEGNSDFHALEATLRHTAGRAQFLFSYTFSKAMDDGSGFGDQVLPDGPNNHFESLSLYDMTQNFSASYTYELPFDRLFRKANRLTQGWRVSGITEFTTGVPVWISEPDDQSLLGDSSNAPFSGTTDEPNFTPGKILNNTNPRDDQPYFNTSLFSEEALGGQGTSARRFFNGPGINNWDLALLKDVKLTESKSLEFRGELFNAFNHAQFYGSGVVNGNFNAGPGAFGMVTSAARGRILQVAMKFSF
ncbi:MAG: carboxypeptidase regulatory-like domain-containing protein [Terriglobia bacterium]